MSINKLQENISEVQKAITVLNNDDAIPKNIRAKLDAVSLILSEDADVSSKVGRSLHVLDEMSEDLNIQPFIRTQLWNITSMLEKLNH